MKMDGFTKNKIGVFLKKKNQFQITFLTSKRIIDERMWKPEYREEWERQGGDINDPLPEDVSPVDELTL